MRTGYLFPLNSTNVAFSTSTCRQTSTSVCSKEGFIAGSDSRADYNPGIRGTEEKRSRIETSRLVLRPFQLSDAQAAFDWFGDPAVTRFTPTGPDESIEETIARLAGYQSHHGDKADAARA
jgi:RimJ/RimL family protein N-acetyltransferase